MRRADRLFEIIQILRASSRPVTAASLAAELEVAQRTVYRDVATLQARRVPIEGEAGVGYVLRAGFDLPPLMFTTEEAEAIAVGVRLLRRIGDPGLQAAAESVLSKVSVILPETLRGSLIDPPFFVSEHGAQSPATADLAAIRGAIRNRRKLRITYADEDGRTTERTIWPIGVAYYVMATLVYGWCELRGDYRHFRADRITSFAVLVEPYPASPALSLPPRAAAGGTPPTAPHKPTGSPRPFVSR